MAVNHEYANLASLPDEVKKLQQMSDKLFAQMQGCDLRRLSENVTFRNGCLPRSQPSPSTHDPGSVQQQSQTSLFVCDSINNLVPSQPCSKHSPSHMKLEETCTVGLGIIRRGSNASPPAFVNPLDYSAHSRLIDHARGANGGSTGDTAGVGGANSGSTTAAVAAGACGGSVGHSSTRVSPAMKSGSSCASYIGSFSSSSSPSPSLPDSCSASFHQESTWKSLTSKTPTFHTAKKPCLVSSTPSDHLNTVSGYASFHQTVPEIPPRQVATDPGPGRTQVKRRGRLRKDAFPTKGCFTDTNELTANGGSVMANERGTIVGSTKLSDTLKTSLKRHMPSGGIGVAGSGRGTVSTAAYKYLTWREKDRRRRFREEWKHLWLVIPHGRYEVMCLVCHKVMTQRKLDTIKRHTVRRHVELLGMPEIDRQNLFEQLIRQHNLMSSVDTNTIQTTTTTSRSNRKTPEASKSGPDKDSIDTHVTHTRTVDSSSWQPGIMSQISLLAASQSTSTGVGCNSRENARDLSNNLGFNARGDFRMPPSGLENGLISSALSSGIESGMLGSHHMFQRAFEELLAETQQGNSVSPCQSNPMTKDSTRTMASASPSSSIPSGLHFSIPLSPTKIPRTAMNYSKANSVSSSFTQILEQLTNSRNKYPVPPEPFHRSPISINRSASNATGPNIPSLNPFPSPSNPIGDGGLDQMSEPPATGTSSHEDRLAHSGIKTDAGSSFPACPTLPTGLEHRPGILSDSVSEPISSASSLAMAAAAAAATAQSLMRLSPHMWPHNLSGALSNRPPEWNPMMMATWAAAAMAAAASGPGNPFSEPTATMPVNSLLPKHSESQPVNGPLKFPYPSAAFPLPPVPSALSTYPSKIPPRGLIPCDMRQGFPGTNLPGSDAIHTKYPDSNACSSRGSINKTIPHGPMDFTKLPHPWNWAFGLPPNFSSATQSQSQSLQPQPPPLSRPPLVPIAPTSSTVIRPTQTKKLNDLSVPNLEIRNGLSRRDGPNPANSTSNGNSNIISVAKPNEFSTKLRPIDRSGFVDSQVKDILSPTSTAPCLVCAWEEKRREGVISDSDPRFFGLDTIPHSCRPSSCNAPANNSSASGPTGVGGGVFDHINVNSSIRPRLSFDSSHGPWPTASDIGVHPNPSGSHPGPIRSHPASNLPTYDPASLPELMKSVSPWYQSFRPPFGPANFDPCMMLYCTELLRQHYRTAIDLNSSPAFDRQSDHKISPRFSRPSSRVESGGHNTGSVGATTGSHQTVLATASSELKYASDQQQSSPISQKHSDKLNTVGRMNRPLQDPSSAPSCASVSSPDATSNSSPLDVDNVPDHDIKSGPNSDRRDCLSPLWWVNLSHPTESKQRQLQQQQPQAQSQAQLTPDLDHRRTSSSIPTECGGPLCMHMLRLTPGQDLRACLSYYVTRQQLNGAFVVTCCGSVQGARLRLANLEVSHILLTGPKSSCLMCVRCLPIA
ncbi:hypothetical protein FGIG_06445 [Fasciola gigantica]|uniref:Uncharacterized protein n=1 Tax=Fasciola gigantica TaxID=46835 RepID=A0A504Z6A9_FASGI|nr:hypothetical protein FGIG_06445 [Fasciola gigantica]